MVTRKIVINGGENETTRVWIYALDGKIIVRPEVQEDEYYTDIISEIPISKEEALMLADELKELAAKLPQDENDSEE